MIRLLFILLLLISTSPAFAKPLVADLSIRQIDIDSGFTGTEILLFGARNDAGDIVVVVRGPEAPYIVRKKEKVAGVWVNKSHAEFTDVSGFYAIAANRPLDQINNDRLLEILGIDLEKHPFRLVGGKYQDGELFSNALLSHHQYESLYSKAIGELEFMGETLFRSFIRFPDNIPRGSYTAEVYLFSEGLLRGMQSTPFMVRKTGFDALIHDIAHKYPYIYGFLAIGLALFAGWVAGLVFRER